MPPGVTSALIRFAADAARLDFLNDCLLPPAATLRILTRGLRSNEGPATVGGFRQRLYLGRRSAVWNNAGDRATLGNEFPNGLVCSQGYGSEALTGPNGPAAPPRPTTPPVVTPPGQRQFVLPPTTFFVMATMEPDFAAVFDLEDGDVVTITTAESALGAAWVNSAVALPGSIQLDGLGPRILPSGSRLAAFGARWIDPPVLAQQIPPTIFKPSETPPQFSLVGAPEGGLIGSVAGTTPFFVGAGFSFTARLAQRRVLRLGINDIEGQHGNNFGFFAATVSVLR